MLLKYVLLEAEPKHLSRFVPRDAIYARRREEKLEIARASSAYATDSSSVGSTYRNKKELVLSLIPVKAHDVPAEG